MPRDPDEFDFFVSYARTDNSNGWITRFVDELLIEHRKFSGVRELTYFFDKQDIASFDDWQHRLHHGLAKSRLILAFISPNYFASEWCRKEWKAWIDTEIAKHILSGGAAPIYFVEVPGFVGKVHGLREQSMLDEHEVARQVAELCRLPEPRDDFITASASVVRQMRDRRQITSDFVQPFQQQGIDALRRDDLRRVLERLARDLDERSERVRLATDSLNTVPPYNKKFSGRLNELLDLRQRLKDDRAGVICGVHGLGGIGKTELAFTYAHAFASEYPGGRFLIPCERHDSLRRAVLHLGDRFRDQISDEQRMTVESYFSALAVCLQRRLATHGRILLVLDNVTDLHLLRATETDALTALGPQLHLLATTREATGKSGGIQWLTLGELTESESVELLEKHRDFANADERVAAQRIARRLGGFSLAVELVAAWLAEHPEVTCETCLQRLGLQDLETLDDLTTDPNAELRRHNHERRLQAVLGPTLAALTPAARRALEYATVLPPDHVPLPWLRSLLVDEFPGLAAAPQPGHADPWQDICRELFGYALVTRGDYDASQLVRVHRLVQSLLRFELSGQERTIRMMAIDELIGARLGELTDNTYRPEARWEVEAFDAFACLLADREYDVAALFLNRIGMVWHRLAEWTRAESLFRRAVAIEEQRVAGNSPGDSQLAESLANYLNNLALLLQETNRLANAEPLIRRALSIIEQSYGVDHAKVAVVLNNLAILFLETNRLEEAEPLIRRALAISEAASGADHLDCAHCLSNLASLLQTTNRLSEAEPLLRRVVAIFEQSYGLEHPDVATALNNLAHLLSETNRLTEAELLQRRALAIVERCYGSEHPDVGISLNNLSRLLLDTNRLTEAEALMRRALAIVERSYGLNHPDVAINLNSLTLLLKATNRVAEAEPLARRALAVAEQSLGVDHPIVATSLNNLAKLLNARDRPSEAEPLIRRALAILQQSLGAEHPEVAINLNDLAALLQTTNRQSEAEPLLRRAVDVFQKAFGANHPDVAIALNNLASLLWSTNRLAEAEPLMRRALRVYSESFGEEHPNTITFRKNYRSLIGKIKSTGSHQ